MTPFKWLASLVLTTTIVPALAESHCPGKVASLPFRLVNRYQIVLPVSVNHSGPYDFLLDTGTQITMVGPSLAAELHLNTQGAAVVSGAGFHESASFTQLDLLEAGTRSVVAHQKVLVYSLLNLRFVDPHIRGILGEDLLEHFDMLIDYAHRLLCFDDSAVMRAEMKGPHIALVTPQTANGAPLPKLLIIAARLSGETRPVRLMLDSGANIPYLYNTSQHLVPQTMAPISFGGRSLVGSGADGNQHVFSALPPQEVRIGSLELRSVTFLTLAYAGKDSRTREFDGLLTTDLFRRVFISHVDHFAVLDPR